MSNDTDNWDDFASEDAEPVPAPAVPKDRTADGFGVRWSLVAGLLLIATITILAAQNTQKVTVNFLGWDGRAPLIAIILGTALISILIDEVIGLLWRRRRRKALAEREELRRLRSERTSD